MLSAATHAPSLIAQLIDDRRAARTAAASRRRLLRRAAPPIGAVGDPRPVVAPSPIDAVGDPRPVVAPSRPVVPAAPPRPDDAPPAAA